MVFLRSVSFRSRFLLSLVLVISLGLCQESMAEQDSLVSNAFNMTASAVGESVNPQTGMLSLTYPAVTIPGKHDLDLNLGIQYGQNDIDDATQAHSYRVAVGWSFSFTYFDERRQLMHLAGGGVYKLAPKNPSGLLYYKLKNLEVTNRGGTVPETERQYKYKLHYVLQGRDEYLDAHGRLIVIRNVYGDQVNFYYKGSSFNFDHITDSYGQTISFDYSVGKVSMLLPGVAKPYVYKTDGHDNLVSITDPESQVTAIQYAAHQNHLPEIINYPSGARTTIAYADMPHHDGQLFHLSYVSKITKDPGVGQPAQTVLYSIGENNYTGNPLLSIVNGDELLTSNNNNYHYTVKTTEGQVENDNTYNHLHLLISSCVHRVGSNTCVYQKKYTYPGEKNGVMPNYENLDPNYQTPTSEVASYKNVNGNGGSRIVTQHAKYNDYGQILSQTSSNGTVAKNIYEESGVDNPLHQVLETETVTLNGSGLIQHVHNYLTSDHLHIQKQVKEASTTAHPKQLQPVSTTTFTYDGQGRVTSQTVTDSAKRQGSNAVTSVTTRFSYLLTGSTRSETVTDQQGNSFTKTYSLASGDLLSSEDATGNKLIYTYDALHRKTSEASQAKNGEKVVLQQISYSNMLNGGKNAMTVTYQNFGSDHGQQSVVKQTLFDGLGRPISVWTNSDDSDANGSGIASHLRLASQIDYNSLGEKADSSIINYDGKGEPRSLMTRYHYDSVGRLSSTIYPDKSVLHQSYDDVAHAMTSYRQGVDGIKSASKIVTLNNENKAVKQITKLNGNSGASLLSSITSPLVVTTQYDGLNRVVGAEHVNMAVQTNTSYNALGKVASNERSNSSNGSIKETFHYNPLVGKVTEKTLTNSHGESKKGYISTYNALGELVSQTDPMDSKQVYTYGPDGNVITKSQWSNEAGQSHYTTYTYQYIAGKNRLTNIRLSNPGPLDYAGTHIEYDNAGHVISMSYVDNRDGEESLVDTIHYSYYRDGKLKTTTYPDGKTVTNTYNEYGKLLTRVDAAGIKSTYTYDDMQRLTKVSSADATVVYDYDSLGHLVERKAFADADMENFVGKTEYTYNAYDAVATITNFDQAGQKVSYFSYQYNDNGDVVKKTSIDNGKTEEVDYVYNTATGALISSKTYTLNVMENEKTLQQAVEYDLDISGNVRRKTVSQPAHSEEGVSDHDNGDSVLQSSYNQLDQITSFEGKGDFKYDQNGNMTQDDQGNVYTYNANNQLISFTGGENGSSQTTTYKYYPDGTRQSKSSQGSTLTFYYADDQLLNAQDSNHKLSSYLLGIKREARTVNGVTHFYNYDRHGSVISTLYLGGAYTGLNHYGNYGKLLSAGLQVSQTTAPSLQDDPFKYAGEYKDGESGLYYLRARYYSPRLMHFIQRDTVDTNNRYAYCRGNPIMRIDPTGNISWSDVGNFFKRNAVGLVIGLVIPEFAAAYFGATLAVSILAGAIAQMGSYFIDSAINDERVSVADSFANLVGGGIGTGISSGLAKGTSMFFKYWAGKLVDKQKSVTKYIVKGFVLGTLRDAVTGGVYPVVQFTTRMAFNGFAVTDEDRKNLQHDFCMGMAVGGGLGFVKGLAKSVWAYTINSHLLRSELSQRNSSAFESIVSADDVRGSVSDRSSIGSGMANLPQLPSFSYPRIDEQGW